MTKKGGEASALALNGWRVKCGSRGKALVKDSDTRQGWLSLAHQRQRYKIKKLVKLEKLRRFYKLHQS